MKISYNWLKDYLGDDLPPVTKVTEILTFHAFEIENVDEIDNDFVIDIKVLPDRASDCLSHRGVARELATILDKELKHDPLQEIVQFSNTEKIKIHITDEKLCPRFMLALFDGVRVTESPDWLKARLMAIGQRPMNNIVDITNYVMFALGQPLHAYDADLLELSGDVWDFEIRVAEKDENIVLLPEKKDGEERIVTLDGSELLVVNKTKNTPISLAGIKGGAKASVSNTTSKIILEAGNFDYSNIRQTAKKLNINTDASKRFENKPAPFLLHVAIKMCVDLISDLAIGRLEGVSEKGTIYRNLNQVEISTSKVNQVLGLSLSDTEIENIFKRIGIETKKVTDGFQVLAPAERADLEIEANYIDEIARIYGLDKIPSITPTFGYEVKVNADYYYQEKFREILVRQGFSEIITSTFNAKDEVMLANALASDKRYLRSSLVPALKQSLKQNIQNVDILGLPDIKIFEIGTVFNLGEDGDIVEETRLALGVMSKKTGYSAIDDKKLQTLLLELQAENLITDFVIKEGVSEISLVKLIPALPTPSVYDEVKKIEQTIYKPFSIYPAIVRDVAMWVNEGVEKDYVYRVIAKVAGELCVKIALFDEFTKDSRISYAFRLVFQADDRTLTDEDVESYVEAIYKAIKDAGFEVR